MNLFLETHLDTVLLHTKICFFVVVVVVFDFNFIHLSHIFRTSLAHLLHIFHTQTKKISYLQVKMYCKVHNELNYNVQIQFYEFISVQIRLFQRVSLDCL